MKVKPSEPIKAKDATPLRFYESDGTRYLCVAQGMFTFKHQERWFTQRIVAMEMTPCPEACNSFGWEPEPAIDPGPWHRLLEPSEPLLDGDEYFGNSPGCWIDTGNLNWRGGEQSKGVTYRRRIAPATRPFANAEEYAPHRDRWVRQKSVDVQYRFRLGDYGKDSVAIDGRYCTYADAHEAYEFEDGSPFGIANTPE